MKTKWKEPIHSPSSECLSFRVYCILDILQSTYQAPYATSRRETCNPKKRSSDTVSCPHQGLAPISLRKMPYSLGSAFFHGCQGGSNNSNNILNIQRFPLRQGLSIIMEKSSPMPCRLGHALFLTSIPWRPCKDPLPESLTTSHHFRLNSATCPWSPDPIQSPYSRNISMLRAFQVKEAHDGQPSVQNISRSGKNHFPAQSVCSKFSLLFHSFNLPEMSVNIFLLENGIQRS